MLVSAIVAMSRAGVIGKNGVLPWRLPRDLKRFREITWGKPILMGRKTWASLGRPLPGRCNIVMTHDLSFTAAGAVVTHTVEEALAAAKQFLRQADGAEVVVIGGAQVYAALLDRCDRLYLSIVEGDFAGDTWFPGGLPGAPAWRVVQEEIWPEDEKNPHAHRFLILEKNKPHESETHAA